MFKTCVFSSQVCNTGVVLNSIRKFSKKKIIKPILVIFLYLLLSLDKLLAHKHAFHFLYRYSTISFRFRACCKGSRYYFIPEKLLIQISTHSLSVLTEKKKKA